MNFELINTDGFARRGRLTFDRGTVETPAFSATAMRCSSPDFRLKETADERR